jgi:hypothetical protein
LSAGITQSSNCTCEVGCDRQPILFSGAPKDSPGVPSSTITADMPLGPSSPVRTITR